MTALTRALWIVAIGPLAMLVPGFFRTKHKAV